MDTAKQRGDNNGKQKNCHWDPDTVIFNISDKKISAEQYKEKTKKAAQQMETLAEKNGKKSRKRTTKKTDYSGIPFPKST